MSSQRSTSSSDLLSATACPSLSPSPSPLPRSSISDTEFDFCDPRNLTVASSEFATTTVSTEFPPLPTLCTGDDNEHRIMLGNESITLNTDTSTRSTFDFSSNSAMMGMHGLDEFSELDHDSEDEFVTGLVSLPTENAIYFGAKRQRMGLLGLEDDSFLSEDESEDFDEEEPLAIPALPIPASINASRRSSQGSAKKQKKQSRKFRKSLTDDEDGFDFDNMISAARFEVNFNTAARGESSSTAQNTGKQAQSSAAQSQTSTDGNQSGSGSDAQAPPPPPVVRRGRKQSLTEDPSKTFVCDLCSRRFRRQEHLKRHYRSLHTQEKPFECNECGKKFSRSDNLSQHARTHGSGAIVMGVLENGEIAPHMSYEDHSPTPIGHVLF